MEGILSQISIGKESSYGSAVTPSVSLPVKESDGIQTNQDVVAVEAIKGTAPKNKGFFKGKKAFEGGYATDLYPNNMGLVLLSALGSVADAVAGGETAVYEHTFTEAVAKKSLTVEQKIGTLSKRFAGFVVKNFKIGGKVGETISFTFEGMGKTVADSTPITASFETERPFNFADVASISVGGTDLKAYIEDFEIEYMNNADIFYAMGSVEPAVSYVKPSECRGKFTLYLDSTTDDLLADFEALVEKEIKITLQGDAIGVASNNEVEITLPKAAISKFETKLSFGYNAISLEFAGREDVTDGLVTLKLVNLVESY